LSADAIQLASKIRLLLMDVDGVLTDGRYWHVPNPDGTLFETKGFNAQDGIALQWLHRSGIEAGLISGRISAATKERARSGKFKYDYEGFTEKIPIIDEIMAQSGLDLSQIAFIGDDFTDVVVMRRVGLGIATANARPEVKACAHYVTEHAGGDGAVRDAIELILKSQGRWEEILRHYEITV
jgi:3-deoxy-D-manno-octulosonate 8-phosphate phosphatase (KDO 8-P phosphatase)